VEVVHELNLPRGLHGARAVAANETNGELRWDVVEEDERAGDGDACTPITGVAVDSYAMMAGEEHRGDDLDDVHHERQRRRRHVFPAEVVKADCRHNVEWLAAGSQQYDET
jgi:hypothetical protein